MELLVTSQLLLEQQMKHQIRLEQQARPLCMMFQSIHRLYNNIMLLLITLFHCYGEELFWMLSYIACLVTQWNEKLFYVWIFAN